VGAAAEVEEVARPVAADQLVVGRLLVDPVQLVGLVQLGEAADGLRVGQQLLLEAVAAGDYLRHALLDRLQVVLRERPGQVEVVVEAVLDRRSAGVLGAREEVGHRRRQDVGRRVPQHVERVAGGFRVVLSHRGLPK
jgi:uncharacterized protein (DUF2342 family)